MFYENGGSTICFDKVNRSLHSSGNFRVCSFNVSVSSEYIAWQIRESEQSEEMNMNRNRNSGKVYKNWQPV